MTRGWTPEVTGPLFGDEPEPHPDGDTYEPALDHDRLTGLLGRVYDLMKDGEWRTLKTIQSFCGGSESSVSARLRDLRKEKFGGHTVERGRVDGGLWRYRVTR